MTSGIATGSGSPYTKSTKYRGIAPCANIVLASTRFLINPFALFGSYSQYIDAVNLIFKTAESQKMPAVMYPPDELHLDFFREVLWV